jgi:hypothetical protein
MKFGPGGLSVLLGVFVCTILQPASAGAATIRDDVGDSNYLALAASSEYAPVGTIVNSWNYNGSAVLISPDWVLTAAHNLILASSATFTINGTAYTSSQLYINPGWNNSNPFGGSDFGLVHLSTPVAGVTPAMLYTGSSETNLIGTFVGYGFTGTGLTGQKTLDGQKRAFQNVIDGNFGNASILLGADFDNPHNPADSGFGDPTPLPLEGCVAPGDSGGGVFITIDSQTYLEGIISFVAAADGNANADYGDASGFGRVSAYLPWIRATIPEPSVSSLLLAGAGLGAVWLRRRKTPTD